MPRGQALPDATRGAVRRRRPHPGPPGTGRDHQPRPDRRSRCRQRRAPQSLPRPRRLPGQLRRRPDHDRSLPAPNRSWRRAGKRNVADNLTDAATDLFGSGALTVSALMSSRPGVFARVQEALNDSGEGFDRLERSFAAYLDAEKSHGRVPDDIDSQMVAFHLIASVHHLFFVGGRPAGAASPGPPRSGLAHRPALTADSEGTSEIRRMIVGWMGRYRAQRAQAVGGCVASRRRRR